MKSLRFSQCRYTVHFMADLIQNSSEMAERAVENCWHKASASENLPGFENEGISAAGFLDSSSMTCYPFLSHRINPRNNCEY
jgi:hypothetical protein